MKLMILGATGLVGHHLLEIALADSRVTQVIAPVRHALPANEKLNAPLVDYEELPLLADWWQVDAVICALGTTRKKAGSQEAFYRVDHDYPLFAARLAKEHGAKTFVLNSAMGADPSSTIFYSRVKGELEQSIHKLAFDSYTIVRPGLIGGHRNEFRLGERLLIALLSLLKPFLPSRWRINPAKNIANVMLDAAVAGEQGEHIISAQRMI